MFLEVFTKYIHFICIFMIVSVVMMEHLLVKPEMQRREIVRLAKLDAIYGISALVLLAAGLILWFAVGKPASFYSQNWIFHIKITLFIIVALLSIYPTRFFLKNRKGDLEEMVDVPKSVKMIIRMELLLLFIIPVLATLMATGVGYFGK